MRLYVLLIIALLAVIAAAVAFAAKPLDPPVLIDAQSPGVWPTYAATNRVEMIDQYSCMRLLAPYRVRTERPDEEVRT